MKLDCTSLKAAIASFSLVQDCELLEDGSLRIATPLLYPDGSNVDVFYRVSQDLFPAPYLTDLGQTVAYLADLHVYPHGSNRRRQALQSVCKTLDVTDGNGELMIPLDSLKTLDLGGHISRLAQACVRVADLCYTQIFRSESSFKDDVADFLTSANVLYFPDIYFEGRFGKKVTVDFSARGKTSKNLVITLSTPNQTAAHSVANETLRKWYDLDRYRKDYGFLTVYDSSSDAFRSDDLERLGSLSSIVSFPAEADALSEILAA